MTYEFTATTFTKTSRLPFKIQRLDGTSFVRSRSWNHERITNEAKALKLVLQQTSVPVPRLLDYGTYPDGRRYLTTEFIEGSRLDTFPARHCSKPEGQKHTIASVDREGMLEDSASKLPEYVFQHGDIAAQNIIMDSQTLQVKALIDLEYAGFYPPQMENWPGTLCPDTYNRHGEKIGHLRRRFLATEYLKCYDKWSNKAELHELIDLRGPNSESEQKAAAKTVIIPSEMNKDHGLVDNPIN
ncbi:hypothetical protein LEMA_P115240.1 [Plenodomus lingam JN3]|uniref:Aminoglycoside phosphotransferase domain-containing protein n=1 Tax=Leptosphaeria maculans (strain JN3 / isolate v23.1.3 / race Av1-4-5-6-7-8) TaxID=985895 RepID=E4ZUN0_LEPMJ|nr:hypothetical protein LEMA_P115240.1 [Plenodomus lingam JN3]CBX95109.1 hypothetical protein LEMA_P115240.1 [Plenodomus lingam JN3]